MREEIYKRIPNSEELFLQTPIIDEPIQEDKDVSQLVEKYNEWIPEPIYKDKDGEPHWLEVGFDLLLQDFKDNLVSRFTYHMKIF